MSTVGVILSTVQGCNDARGGYHDARGGYHDARAGYYEYHEGVFSIVEEKFSLSLQFLGISWTNITASDLRAP